MKDLIIKMLQYKIMRRIKITLFLYPNSLGQAPQGVNYQAVAYDANGFELSNKEVGVRISIVEGSAFGTPQLVEEHDVVTTEQGLFSIIIGQGALLGGEVESLLDIPWGSNTYFLKIELDTENNGSYMDFGTQQFMSVPYALYAESSGTPGPEGPQGPQGEPADPVDYESLVNELILDSAFMTFINETIFTLNDSISEIQSQLEEINQSLETDFYNFGDENNLVNIVTPTVYNFNCKNFIELGQVDSSTPIEDITIDDEYSTYPIIKLKVAIGLIQIIKL